MLDKKIKILYDTSFLSFSYNKNSNRSGIFFVAYNILKEFINHTELEITFYCDYKRFWYMKDILEQDETLKQFKMIEIKNICNPVISYLALLNYKCRKDNSKTDNILKKAVRYITYRCFHLYDKIKIYNPTLAKQIDNFDVYFSPYYMIPQEFLQNWNIKRFLFLHDVIPFVLDDFYGSMNFAKSWYCDLLKSLNNKDYYFANSECTKRDFIKYAKEIDPDKIVVTYLGANENFYQEKDIEKIKQIKQKYNIEQDKKYIFSLCTLEPRKNLIFAIKNFIEFIKKNNINDFVFVLGGGYWEKFLPQLEKAISNLEGYKDKIIKIGYVDDEDLAALYSGAEMFVYPSIYEGFGMPVLEAMQCGCPVITSNISSLPEVIGDCGIQINPKDDEELIKAYEKMYFDGEFSKECSKKGLERAKQFCWENCTGKIIEVIKHQI